MSESSISSASAITTFGIVTGVASGLAAMYLSTRFGNQKITKNSMILGITVAAAATLVGAFLYKSFSKEEKPEPEIPPFP